MDNLDSIPNPDGWVDELLAESQRLIDELLADLARMEQEADARARARAKRGKREDVTQRSSRARKNGATLRNL